MNRRSLLWGLGLVAAGAVLATDLLPFASGMATGPRVGLVSLLATLGVVLVLIANARWILRRLTNPADYQGGCPVGASCGACGAFNFKPRTVCRSCDADLAAMKSQRFERDGPVES